MSTLFTLIQDNVGLLRQGVGLLAELEDELYARSEPELGGSGVGVHFRHCIDFYARLLEGLPAGRIDYDLREREARLETDRGLALRRLGELIADLRQLEDGEPSAPVRVRAECADPDSDGAPSSLERELQALLSHTVHHFSLVAVALRLAGRKPPENFGVALSTLNHRLRGPGAAPA